MRNFDEDNITQAVLDSLGGCAIPGVSMLVDAITDRFDEDTAQTTMLGPFHVEEVQDFPIGAHVSRKSDGTALLIEGTIEDSRGNPIAGALIESWHADDRGFYDVQRDTLA